MDVTEHSGLRPTDYERVLRAVGVYLDGEDGGWFRLIEVPDGVTLFVEGRNSQPSCRELHFSVDGLNSRAESLSKGRRFLGSAHENSWKLVSTTHEDFLRALGWELSDSNAHALLIDELEDGLLVTYSYLDPARGFQWRKQLIVMQVADMQGIIAAGRGRRAKRGFLR
jgi:hypothetical protein